MEIDYCYFIVTNMNYESREKTNFSIFISSYIETRVEVNVVVLSLAKGNTGMNSTVKLDNPSTMKAEDYGL